MRTGLGWPLIDEATKAVMVGVGSVLLSQYSEYHLTWKKKSLVVTRK